MKFSVLAAIVAVTSGGQSHHKDELDKKTIKDNTLAEEDRHWMIPDNNHIMSLNSQHLLV